MQSADEGRAKYATKVVGELQKMADQGLLDARTTPLLHEARACCGSTAGGACPRLPACLADDVKSDARIAGTRTRVKLVEPRRRSGLSAAELLGGGTILPHHLTNLLIVGRSRPLEAGMPFRHSGRLNTWTHAWPVTVDITLPHGGLNMAELGYKHLQGVWGRAMFTDERSPAARLRQRVLNILKR